MKHDDFKIGEEFVVTDVRGPTSWLVTDIGTRVIVAIRVKERWMSGPPYTANETVFDENDMPACERQRR